MKFAYADPPYIGQAKKHYGSEEVNHAELFQELDSGSYDGWALSCSSPSLFYLCNSAPEDCRIGSWVKPFAIFKPGVNPAYAWEPVIFKGGRKRSRKEPTVRDWCSVNITLKRGLCGAKPEAFCFWLFELLGMEPSDELHDLFPGTGAVSDAWEVWKENREGVSPM